MLYSLLNMSQLSQSKALKSIQVQARVSLVGTFFIFTFCALQATIGFIVMIALIDLVNVIFRNFHLPIFHCKLARHILFKVS